MTARCDVCGCTDEEGLSGTGSELMCNACLWSELLAARATAVRSRMAVGHGWAVRIKPSSTSVAWLTHGGGYVATRSGRAIWHDYDDALDGSHKWDACRPIIVRVRFYTLLAEFEPIATKKAKR